MCVYRDSIGFRLEDIRNSDKQRVSFILCMFIRNSEIQLGGQAKGEFYSFYVSYVLYYYDNETVEKL